MRLEKLVFCIVTVCAASCNKSQDRQTESLIAVPKNAEGIAWAAATDLNQDHGNHGDWLIGYGDSSLIKSMPESLSAEARVLDGRLWSYGAYDQESLEQISEPEPVRRYEGYHNYEALTAELQRLASEFPELVRLESAGRSVQGRELWYLVISDNAGIQEPEPKFIYHANMHGDEVVGRELMIYFARYLLAGYGSDQRITQILNNSQLFIMPSMNPDGFERGTRANALGYDLNRNFPDRFQSTSDTPGSRQIEVQHMMKLAADNHFIFGMNWHGGEICFNLPWGNIRNDRSQNRHGDDAFFNPIGREFTELNRPMYANHQQSFEHGLTYGYEWYPVNGGINDWFNFFRRSLHAVVELSVTKWPESRYLEGFWNDNKEAMITYLWRGLRGVHLEVRDPDGQIIVEPTINISSSPGRPIKFDNGFIDRLAPEGTHHVRIDADGYSSAEIDVAATYLDGSRTVVILNPE